MTKDIVINITWWATPDACPKCSGLHGYVFRDVDIFQSHLTHPIYGDVWDLDLNISLMHPNCKCCLEVTIEVTPISEWTEYKEFEMVAKELS